MPFDKTSQLSPDELKEKLFAPIGTMEELAERLLMIPDGPEAPLGFDMENSVPFPSSHPCGTACCIGGWVNEANRKQMRPKESVLSIWPGGSEGAAWRLCFPQFDGCHAAYQATNVQGAQAVLNCIRYGEPRWREVMGLDPEE